MATQRSKLGALIADTRSPLAADALMDSIVAVSSECKASHVRRLKTVENFRQRYGNAVDQIKQLRPKQSDFEKLKVIGRGAYGEVQLVRHKESHELFALKTLSKCEMLKKADSAFYWEERDIMSHAQSPWIVRLHFAFQDDNYLYMAMDYMAGGDLVTLLEKQDFPQDWARFYAAELILALEDLHGMGYVHRDVKPDNVLLDAKGHLKLADFGTCVKMDKDGMVNNPGAAVGTPDYISPEVLDSQNGNGRYGSECDWWSVGVFLYELLFGEPPFYDDTLLGTYGKILGHEPDNLEFPGDVPVGDAAKDLLRKLLCPRDKRLGAEDITELKAHPFFHGVEWDSLRSSDAPHIPTIEAATDTSNFPDVERATQRPETFSEERSFSGNQLPFIGFTFHRDRLQLPAAQGAAPALSSDHDEDVGVASLKATNERLEETVSRLKGEVQTLTQELRTETAAKAQAVKEAADLKETLTTNETKLSSEVEKKHAISQLEIEQLQAKIKKMEEARQKEEARLKATADDLRQKYTESREENSALSTRISRLQSEVDAAKEERKARQSQVGRSPRRSQAVVMDFDATEGLQQKLNAANRAKQTLRAQIEDLETQLETAERNARREKKKCAQLQEELEEARADLRDAKKEMASASTRCRDVEHQYDSLKESVTQKDTRLRELRKKCAQYEVDIDELRTTLDKEVALRARLASVEETPSTTSVPDSEEVEAMKKELQELRTSIKAARATEDTYLTQMEALEDEVARLRAENKKSTANARMLEEQLAEIENKNINALEQEMLALKGEKEVVQSEVEELKETITQRETALASTKEQLVASEERSSQLETEAARTGALQTALDDVEAQKDAAAAQAETYRQETADLHQQIAALAAKKETLESRVTSVEEEAQAAASARDDAHAKLEELEAWKKRHTVETEHEVTALQQEAQRHKGKATDLAKQLEVAAASHEKHRQLLMGQITKLKEDKEAAEGQLVSKTAVIEEQRTKLTQLNNQVKEMEELRDIALKQREQAIKGLEVLQVKTTHGTGTSRDADKHLQQQLKKQRRLARNAQAEAHKLKQQMEAMVADHKKHAATMMEEQGRMVRGLQAQFQEDEDEKAKQIEELQTKCAAKDQTLRALQNALDRVQADESVRKFGSTGLRRTLSGLRINNEGWVCMPGDRGIKKSGWRSLYAVLDVEGLKLFDNNDAKTRASDPLLMVRLQQLVAVEPAQRQELIHANAADVPLVFKVQAARLDGQGVGSEEARKKSFALPRSMSFALPMRQKSDGSEPKKGGFWKSHGKGKSSGHGSKGTSGDDTCVHYFLKAESLAEQRAWVSRLTVAIEKRDELKDESKAPKDKSFLAVPREGGSPGRAGSSPALARKASGLSTSSTSSRASKVSAKSTCV